MNRFIVLFFLLLASLMTFASEKVALFVDGQIDDDELFLIESKVAEQLSSKTNLVLLQRTSDYLNAGDQERAYQLSGEVNPNQVCALGERWGAKYVISVCVREVRGTMTISGSVYNIATGAEVARISNHKKIKDYDGLVVLSSIFGSNLCSVIRNKIQ